MRETTPANVANQGRCVAQAGGATRLATSYRLALLDKRMRARAAGKPPRQIEAARREGQESERRCFGIWREQEAAHHGTKPPPTRPPSAATRQARPRQRRDASSSRTSSADPGDDGPGEPPPPPEICLWRHPHYGAISANLLCLLFWEATA